MHRRRGLPIKRDDLGRDGGYMLERIEGLKINGRRLRVDRQEIDLCCVNVSVKEELWSLVL